MDSAIHFNGQITLSTEEVEDVRPYGMLAAKLQTIEPIGPNRLPKHDFGKRHAFPEFSRALEG